MNNSSLIFEILMNSGEAIIALDLNCRVIFWNHSAEKLFKYKSNEVIGKYPPIITQQSKYEIDYALEKAKEGKQLNFRTSKKDKHGEVLDLIFVTTPISKNNLVIGFSINIQKTDILKKVCYLPVEVEPIEREQKRTFSEIRDIILITILDSKKTINQIANDSAINWRTVEKHLTYLMGKKLVSEVLSSKYVRIFELTNEGLDYISKLKKEKEARLIKRE